MERTYEWVCGYGYLSGTHTNSSTFREEQNIGPEPLKRVWGLAASDGVEWQQRTNPSIDSPPDRTLQDCVTVNNRRDVVYFRILTSRLFHYTGTNPPHFTHCKKGYTDWSDGLSAVETRIITYIVGNMYNLDLVQCLWIAYFRNVDTRQPESWRNHQFQFLPQIWSQRGNTVHRKYPDRGYNTSIWSLICILSNVEIRQPEDWRNHRFLHQIRSVNILLNVEIRQPEGYRNHQFLH